MKWWVWPIAGVVVLWAMRNLMVVLNSLPQVPFWQSRRHFRIMKQIYRSGSARIHLKGVPEKYIQRYEGLIRRYPGYFEYRSELKRIINEMRRDGLDTRQMAAITTIWKDTYFDI